MGTASTKDIKNRIKSVEGTMQITKAMELVATSKLKNAKVRAESVKPYMNMLSEAISVIGGTPEANEIFPAPQDAKTLYIVIAGDRGLAGGYNSNIFKLISSLDKDKTGIYIPIGKKACEYFSRHSCELFDEGFSYVSSAGVGKSISLGHKIYEALKSGLIYNVKLVYTRFISMMTQLPVYEDIFPLCENEAKKSDDLILEGEISDIFDNIMPGYIGGTVFSAISESFASECASRRSAMNSANKNAEEMISDLVLKFNRARQAVITQEINEIVSGAEAL